MTRCECFDTSKMLRIFVEFKPLFNHFLCMSVHKQNPLKHYYVYIFCKVFRSVYKEPKTIKEKVYVQPL